MAKDVVLFPSLTKYGYTKNLYFTVAKHQQNNSVLNILPSNARLNDNNVYELEASKFKNFLKTYLIDRF